MRLASFTASAAVGILLFCFVSDAAAQGGPRSGWYLSGGIGSRWASDMGQEGWNRETTCYPTDACFDADTVPQLSGYRWKYDIGVGSGTAFEVAAGRLYDRTRLEFSFAHRRNDLDQMFTGIAEYDGTPLGLRSGGTVVSNSQASIDHLAVSTLALNAYYDFPNAFDRFSPYVDGLSPYVGGGLGPAFAEVAGVHFSTDYQDTSRDAPAYDPPLSFYNSRQDEDLSGTVVAGHLYAGLDYDLNARTSWGLKLTYSMLSGFESKGDYSVHPFHEQDPDFLNYNTFSGLSHWTLAFTVKRLFGN